MAKSYATGNLQKDWEKFQYITQQCNGQEFQKRFTWQHNTGLYFSGILT